MLLHWFCFRSKDGNSARWGYCANIPAQACQVDDANDADAVIGLGIAGQDCCPSGAGYTNYFVSNRANSGQESRQQVWVFVTASPTAIAVLQCLMDYQAAVAACPYIKDGYCDEGESCPAGTDPDDCRAQYEDYVGQYEDYVAGSTAALAECTSCESGSVEVEPCRAQQLTTEHTATCDLDAATDGTADCLEGTAGTVADSFRPGPHCLQHFHSSDP